MERMVNVHHCHTTTKLIYIWERVGKILIYELTTQRIGLLNRIKHLLPLDVRIALYNALLIIFIIIQCFNKTSLRLC